MAGTTSRRDELWQVERQGTFRSRLDPLAGGTWMTVGPRLGQDGTAVEFKFQEVFKAPGNGEVCMEYAP